MRKLRIAFYELEAAIESRSMESQYYLDTTTGSVLLVTDEFISELEALLEEADPDAPIEEVIAQAAVPEWQKQALREAHMVTQTGSDTFVAVPDFMDVGGDYRAMDEFTESMEDQSLRAELRQAISGRGAFSRFRAIVFNSPRLSRKWHKLLSEKHREQMEDWLATLDIEPVWEMPASSEATEPPVRAHLLAAVREFTTKVSALRGVKRITLFGSLSTDEPEPDDAELLVTVDDDMNLAPLAKATRHLTAAARHQYNLSAEVYLADPKGQHIGRVCLWKKCGPYLHAACEALHCGRREYLYDDLQVFKLDDAIVQSPPVELWPDPAASIPVPADVQELLRR